MRAIVMNNKFYHSATFPISIFSFVLLIVSATELCASKESGSVRDNHRIDVKVEKFVSQPLILMTREKSLPLNFY